MAGSKKDKKPDFRRGLASFGYRHNSRTVFEAFVALVACAVSLQTREDEYMTEVKRWEKDDLTVFATAFAALVSEMDDKPYTDVLGPYYMEHVLNPKSAQWNGEFYTPQELSRLIGQMLVTDTPESGPITVCEPACGSGSMVLSYVQALPQEDRDRVLVTAVDTNKLSCDMAFINFTLWRIAANVVHGNSLGMQEYASWLTVWHPLFTASNKLQPIKLLDKSVSLC